MAKGNGLFVQGEVLGVKTFGEVHSEVAIHVGDGNVIKAVSFGSKKEGKASALTVELNKLGERATICLELEFMPARDGREAGFAALSLRPVGQ